MAPGHPTHAWHRVTDGPKVPDRPLVVPTLERFAGRDGLPLTGWLYRAPPRPGPAALSLHGGPEAQERPTFDPQHQALAAAGITVFAPNIRGSSGFGREFVHADDVHGRYARVRRRPGLRRPPRVLGLAERTGSRSPAARTAAT